MLCNQKTSFLWLALLWIGLSIVCRLLPHPFNATPLLSFALCAPYFLNRKQSTVLIVLCMILSNSMLTWIKGYPLLGSWSIFTYSGIVLLMLCNSFQHYLPSFLKLTCITLSAVSGFWLWTNFGTWFMTSDLYPHTFTGLGMCYLAGLPFLGHNLIASTVWSCGIMGTLQKYTRLHFATLPA